MKYLQVFIVCFLLLSFSIPTIAASKTYTNSIGIKFVLIPAGTFIMGGGKHPSEKPHQVTITKPFYMSIYEITQEQWGKIVKKYPGDSELEDAYEQKMPKHPVSSVSIGMAYKFIDKLNEIDKTKKYRLPTEAEWEYAARAGTTTDHYYGTDDSVENFGKYAQKNLIA